MNCPRFETCNAPICPLDEGSILHAIWYPKEEEVCMLMKYANLPWVRRQKRYAKRAKPGFYFTHQMLCQDCVITKGTEGLDPNREQTVKSWLQKHPVKKQMSEEERKAVRDRFIKTMGISGKKTMPG